MRNMRTGTLGTVCGLVLLTVLGGCAGSDRSYEPRVEGYVFWPAAPAEPRVQFVRSFQNSRDLSQQQESALERMVFGEESDADQAGVDKPYGVHFHDGKIYVCDIGSASVAIFDLKKEQMRLMGIRGLNRLTHPVDVTVADDGWIYVADNEANAIAVFTPDERYAKTYGRPGMNPVSIAVAGDVLYVCDLEAQRVELFDRHTGDSIGTFGEVGDGDGEFRVPLCVEIDRAGYVYVTDMMQARIQKFTAEGEFVDAFGQLGDTSGSFARPKQLAVDGAGRIYVVDASFQNVQVFNDEFALLANFGSAGAYPGATNMPVGISATDEMLSYLERDIHPGFEPESLIVLTNQFGLSPVSVYAVGGIREGWTREQLNSSGISIELGEGQNPEMQRLQSEEMQTMDEDDQESAADDTEQTPPPPDESEPNG